MVTRADYRPITAGQWSLLALPDRWDSRFESKVLALVRGRAAERHPQTIEVCTDIAGAERFFYVKLFHRVTPLAATKGLLRQSKAFRFWQQGLALSAAGFKVPLTIAAGVERGWGTAKREFVVTEKIDGAPVPLFLRRDFASGTAKLAFKRDNLKALARLVRQFHTSGFVHGDLVASNLFVVSVDSNRIDFYFMDNDRTRHYPAWLPQAFWKRNLIQLNRMPLPGISLQDRMRFLYFYLNVRRLSAADRQFARWLERRTRQRRKECDGADPTVSFRKLMRWAPEMASAKDT